MLTKIFGLVMPFSSEYSIMALLFDELCQFIFYALNAITNSSLEFNSAQNKTADNELGGSISVCKRRRSSIVMSSTTFYGKDS